MSTRATYGFKGSDPWEGDHTFYIHSDGYPEGAASYFYDYHKQRGRSHNKATDFIRANSNAELTRSHKSHCDTEYKYEYDSSTDILKAYEIHRKWNKDYSKSTEKYELIYDGVYSDFINKHISTGWVSNFEYIMHIENNDYGSNFMTGSEINNALEDIQQRFTEEKQSAKKYKRELQDPTWYRSKIAHFKNLKTMYNKYIKRYETLTELEDKDELQPAGV